MGSTTACMRGRVVLRAGMRGDMGCGWRGIWSGGTVLAALAILVVLGLAGAPLAQAASADSAAGSSVLQPVDQWPGYLQNSGRTGFNGTEVRINPASAIGLIQRWTYTAPGPISAQSVEANGLVYVGSWDGYERALTTQGQVVWSRFLGQTSDSSCDPTLAGVASTPTVTQTMPGDLRGEHAVLYVGGGDGQLYALDALTGAVQWVERLGPSPSTFLWSSPLVYGGSVYIGVSSFGDCPLVQGRLVQLDAATGMVQHSLSVVPNSCVGGGVWGSPALDAATGIIYFATGNPGGCGTNEPYADALIAVHASTLSLASFWQIPASQLQPDEDFGSSATLFTATIAGVSRSLLGIVGKNGLYYAFDRTNIGAGPIWTVRIAVGGDCPQCGEAAIAPAAWDGRSLYAAGGTTTINGQSCLGSVQALDPATGTPHWRRCLSTGPVLGAVTAVPGVVFAGAGPTFYALAASSGATLFSYTDPRKQVFYGAASIASGSVYIGNMDGTLFCFGVGLGKYSSR